MRVGMHACVCMYQCVYVCLWLQPWLCTASVIVKRSVLTHNVEDGQGAVWILFMIMICIVIMIIAHIHHGAHVIRK